MKPIHIFKTGTHTDSHGKKIEFSEADLASAIACYDPKLSQAPIVVGHPATDNPAYGWISKMTGKNGNLYAIPEQLNADFSEQVKAGAYKKISPSFYPPNSPNNPVKGSYYLRHVGFLGATPPAIKGLEPVEFSKDDDDFITLELDFSEPQTPTNEQNTFAQAMKSLWTLVFGEGEPSEMTTTIDSDNQVNAKPSNESEPNLTINQPETNKPNPTDEDNDMATQAELDAEKARADKLQAQLDERDKAEAKAKAEALAKENADFAEGLVDDGKLAPKDKQMVTAILDGLDTADSVKPVEFGEGDDKQSLKQALKDKLATANTDTFSYLFSEAASKPTNKAVEFDAPQGTAVDADRLAMHNQALEYAEAHNVGYDEAITHVAVG